MTVADLASRVATWMRDFGQAVPDSIQEPTTATRFMRQRLIDEENIELLIAETDAERLDAIADLLVVVVGAAADLGIKPETLQAQLEDVLKANDAKRWTVEETAKTPRDWVVSAVPWSGMYAVRDQNGKIRKPPGWTAPDPQCHIEAQRRAEA